MLECMRHGEYKTPGGKLVIVDFRVDSGRIDGMQVNGDFFLEPAEALTAINASLEGADVNLSETALAQLISDQLPAGTEMIGFSPEGIAIAIRRALQ
jgi:lipoate-protein ligase A